MGTESGVAVGSPRRERAKSAAAASSDAGELPQVRVRGLTGTLNKDDVHQAMDARQPQFDDCIREVRRRQAWVEGTIRFAFKVDGTGRVETAHPTESPPPRRRPKSSSRKS